MVPMYLPDSTYTFGDAVAPELALPQFNVPSCPYVRHLERPERRVDGAGLLPQPPGASERLPGSRLQHLDLLV